MPSIVEFLCDTTLLACFRGHLQISQKLMHSFLTGFGVNNFNHTICVFAMLASRTKNLKVHTRLSNTGLQSHLQAPGHIAFSVCTYSSVSIYIHRILTLDIAFSLYMVSFSIKKSSVYYLSFLLFGFFLFSFSVKKKFRSISEQNQLVQMLMATV